MDSSVFGDKKITCCFTGHRSLSADEKAFCLSRLTNAVETLIRHGVTRFITGGALGFDTIAAVTVLNLKKRKFPDIKIAVAVPFKGQSDRWSASDRALYNTILSEADKVITLSEDYTSYCMSVRNRYMADSSSYCISYVTKSSGGSYYTENYAKKHGLCVFNLATEKEVTLP